VLSCASARIRWSSVIPSTATSSPRCRRGLSAGNATPHGKNGTPGIVVCLTDGHELPVWALAEESTVFSVKKRTLAFAPLAAELNALLATLRPSTAVTSRS
jgi:hypothetical protein